MKSTLTLTGFVRRIAYRLKRLLPWPFSQHFRLTEVPEFGFSWNESNFDPFKENDISQSLREQAAWFLEQDKLDSKFRKNQIKSILKRMPLKDNQLIAMTFNSKFSLLFLNWAASALKYGIDVHDRCIVFPMDDESAGMAQREGFSICYNRDS